VTFDLWNTLLIEKNYTQRRLAILREAITSEGEAVDPDALREVYRTAQKRHDDLWSRDYRHYPLPERVDDILRGVNAKLSQAEKIWAMEKLGDTILEDPPILTEGAAETVSRMAGIFRLGIISDTGVTSGSKIKKLLDRRGILKHFTVTIFSDETMVCKPRREAFEAALSVLEVKPSETLHVGDLLRTDVVGAKAACMMGVWLKIREPDAGNVTPDYTITKLSQLLDIPEIKERL